MRYRAWRERHIAIDGKARRGCADNPSAFNQRLFQRGAQLISGQASVDVKGNEITAIPTLLELLDIQGATVTIDAMLPKNHLPNAHRGCWCGYVLALKDNHPTLHEDVTL
jgi:hypothetical protein